MIIRTQPPWAPMKPYRTTRTVVIARYLCGDGPPAPAVGLDGHSVSPFPAAGVFPSVLPLVAVTLNSAPYS